MIRPEDPSFGFQLIGGGKINVGNSRADFADVTRLNVVAVATIEVAGQLEREQLFADAFFAGKQQCTRHALFFEHASQKTLDAVVSSNLIEHTN